MKSLYIFSICMMLGWSMAWTQTPIEKSINTQAGQKVFVEADYANLHFSSSTNNEIKVTGTIKINNGENDEAFELNIDKKGEDILISTNIKGYNRLPHMLMYEKDGKKYYEKIDKEEHHDWGGGNQYSIVKKGKHITYGVITEIDLYISIPKKLSLDVEAVYGQVHLNDFSGPLRIDNTYGSIDAVFSSIDPNKKTDLHSTYNYVDISLPKRIKTNLKLSSSYGEIFTDMDIKMEKSADGLNAYSSSIIRGMLNGGGPKLDVEATYSNIYIRELKQ